MSCYTRKVISPKPLLTEATSTPGSELLYKEGYFTQTTAYWSNTNTWEWAVIQGRLFHQTTAYWSNTNTWEWAVIQGRLFHLNHCLLKQHQHLGVSCYTRKVISPKPLLTEATPTPGSELLYKEGYFTKPLLTEATPTPGSELLYKEGYFTSTTAYWSNTNTWEWAVIQGRLFHLNHCLLKQHQHLGVSCYTWKVISPKPLLTEATPTPGSELLYKEGYFTQTTAYWSNTNTWGVSCYTREPKPLLTEATPTPGSELLYKVISPKPLLTEATPTPGSELLYKVISPR